MTDKSNTTRNNTVQKRYYPQNTRIFLGGKNTNGSTATKRIGDEYNLVFTVSAYFVGNIGTFILFAICIIA